MHPTKPAILAFCLLATPVAFPSELVEINPVLAERGELLWESTFHHPGSKPPETKLGKIELKENALRLEERKADHHQAAVTLFQTGPASGIPPLTELIMQADFKSEHSSNFQIGFNRIFDIVKKGTDGKKWEVAPHVLTIAFNQPPDPAKKHNWLVDDNSVEPFFNLGTHPLVVEPGIWYRILIEFKGDEVSVQLNNGQTIRGKAMNPNDPKTGPILRCQGEEGTGVLWRNVKLWKVRNTLQ